MKKIMLSVKFIFNYLFNISQFWPMNHTGNMIVWRQKEFFDQHFLQTPMSNNRIPPPPKKNYQTG